MSLYYGLGALGVGLAAFYFVFEELRSGFRARKRTKALASDSPLEPEDLARGAGSVEAGDEVTVVGTVTADDPLDVPIGDGECVAYHLDMFLGPNEEGFPYEDHEAATPFSVEGTRAAVEVDDVEELAVEAAGEHRETYRSSVLFDDNPDDLPQELLDFLDADGVPEPSGFGRVEYEQRQVPVGATAAVHGTLERRSGEPVLTAGDGPFVVADREPDSFVEQRPSIAARTVKGAGIYLAASIAFVSVGLVLVIV